MEAIEAHLNTGKLINKLLDTIGVYIAVLLITFNTYPEDMKIYFKILIYLLAAFFVLVLVLKSSLVKLSQKNDKNKQEIDTLMEEDDKKNK